jgi:antitoxin (DNA-binding transcriptional repressor) of toxin-antitoxin stability system
MTTTISVTKIARHLADYLNRVAYRGESFLLVRGNKAVAELRPVSRGTKLGDLPALLTSLPRLSADEADAFAKDLDLMRKERAESEDFHNPWAT